MGGGLDVVGQSRQVIEVGPQLGTHRDSEFERFAAGRSGQRLQRRRSSTSSISRAGHYRQWEININMNRLTRPVLQVDIGAFPLAARRELKREARRAESTELNKIYCNENVPHTANPRLKALSRDRDLPPPNLRSWPSWVACWTTTELLLVILTDVNLVASRTARANFTHH